MASRGSSHPERPSTPEAVGKEWADLLRLLPGYDPFKHPGGSWFDATKAERVIAFVEECCRHVEGKLADTPFVLEPWEKCIVANLFGWVRENAAGQIVRRFREALVYIPRKNGKSPLAASIALYVLFGEEEAGQQNYIAAADREQAGKLFRHCKGMIEREPELAKRCRIFGGRADAGQSKSIVLNRDASFIQVISADANTKHGGNTHLVIVDELHAQPNRDLVDVLTTSTASENRAQPLTLYLTTADYDRPSICNEKYEQACRVRDGVSDDASFLPAIYEVKEEDDWRDEKVWAKANPNLGISVSLDYLRRAFANAEGNPALLDTLKRLHLNLRTGSAKAAIDLARWDACPTFDLPDLEGRDCWAALDLSSTTDLTALVLLCWFRDEKRWAILPRFYAPREKARDRSRLDRVPYLSWAEQGFLTLTDGSAVDYDVIRRDANELAQQHHIRRLAADKWNATQLLIQLGNDGLPVERFTQGMYSFTAPTKELLKLVAESSIMHNNNPVLRWMAGNFVIERDAAGNEKPNKAKSRDRIDGIVAAIMALGVGMQDVAEEESGAAVTIEVW